MSAKPSVHRIHLNRAWTTPESTEGPVVRERCFHSPTNLGAHTRVGLCITSTVACESVVFNQRPLVLQTGLREYDDRIGYEWEITEHLESRNQLVLRWTPSDSCNSDSLPRFDVWLEIQDLE